MPHRRVPGALVVQWGEVSFVELRRAPAELTKGRQSLLNNSASPGVGGPDFIVHKNEAVFGTQTFGLLGSRHGGRPGVVPDPTPPPPEGQNVENVPTAVQANIQKLAGTRKFWCPI